MLPHLTSEVVDRVSSSFPRLPLIAAVDFVVGAAAVRLIAEARQSLAYSRSRLRGLRFPPHPRFRDRVWPADCRFQRSHFLPELFPSSWKYWSCPMGTVTPHWHLEIRR